MMEYAVLLLGVLLVAIVAVRAVGTANAPLFQPANEAFPPGGGGGGGGGGGDGGPAPVDPVL